MVLSLITLTARSVVPTSPKLIGTTTGIFENQEFEVQVISVEWINGKDYLVASGPPSIFNPSIAPIEGEGEYLLVGLQTFIKGGAEEVTDVSMKVLVNDGLLDYRVIGILTPINDYRSVSALIDTEYNS